MKRTHDVLDRRSLDLHRLIAERLREQPEKLESVRRTLARWKTIVAPNSQPYVAEWQRLVDAGLDVALAMAVEDSERATALRQSAPFACSVLTPRERWAFLKQWNDDHATA